MIRTKAKTQRKEVQSMKNEIALKEEKVNPIFEEIRNLVNRSRERVYSTVNTEMLNLYWNIGKIIMEIQNCIDGCVTLMDEGNRSVKEGIEMQS